MKTEFKQLIVELGGPEKIYPLVLDFYKIMAHDILVGFFFDKKDITEIARKQSEFILFVAGFQPYKGKQPATAHLELPPILKGHFDRRLTILREYLLSRGLTKDQVEVWIGFENQFRSIIVEEL